jgi:hypothetical protein
MTPALIRDRLRSRLIFREGAVAASIHFERGASLLRVAERFHFSFSNRLVR